MLMNFPHIIIHDFTGDIIQDTQNFLYTNNKVDTYKHSKAVAETNVKIAEQYGLDKRICEISGFLHDISAVFAPHEMMEIAENNGLIIDESEKRYPFLLHQRISRIIAEQVFNISEKRILDAVECHTTLKTNPSPYDMALFVADKLSWDKDGLPPFYEIVKDRLEISLEAASLSYMEYMIDNNMILYPHKWFEEGMRYLQHCNNNTKF